MDGTIKKAIKFAYQIKSPGGRHQITMPDNQKIKLTSFPLKNIDDERSFILAAQSTSAYTLDPQKMPYGAAISPIELPNHNRTKNYYSSNAWYSQAGLAVKTYLSGQLS